MHVAEPATIQEQKRSIRQQAHARRAEQPNKDETSAEICEKLAALPEYAAARTVLFYIDVRAEVRTRAFLPVALAHGKRVAVPYCTDRELQLYLLEDMSELDIGMYKILEPKKELCTLPEKRIAIGEIDLVVVPGVAFDPRGARLGHGFGYYDKLLARARPDAPRVALAFQRQIFREVPADDHDVFMDKIVTEAKIYDARANSIS